LKLVILSVNCINSRHC